ncbi:hypothetical protein E1B28_007483 [Marasmius oreades]|uniref:Uncharacterized protein n=1 Tax=Marasmius oreades TaxID=181124 RepID=A0A9P7UVU0_9AGAR|nr:uncharacterized protein E1B28_007483 [Marasmius oreades]KAG7093844.1 hypothetical protein E1B28_007483 [Marasmius oreades]
MESSGEEQEENERKAQGMDITIDISILSAVEMKKTEKKHKSVPTYLVINSNDVWNVLRNRLFEKMSSALNTDGLSCNDYAVTFTVARISPQPMPLACEDDYKQLISHSLKAKSELTARILAIEKAKKNQTGNKENTGIQPPSDEDDEVNEKKTKKKKVHL